MKKKKKWKKVKDFFTSLRFIVFASIMIASLIPIYTAGKITYSEMRSNLIKTKQTQIQNQAVVFVNQILASGYMYNTQKDTIDIQMSQFADDVEGRVMVADSSFLVLSDTSSVNEGRFMMDRYVLRAFDKGTPLWKEEKDHVLELVTPIVGTAKDTCLGTVIVAVGLSGIDDQMMEFEKKQTLLNVIILTSIFFAAVVISTILAGPFRKLRNSAERVSRGADTKIKKTGYSELTEVIDSFNAGMERLQVIDASRQEFVSSVSHELKTPITSIRVLADSLMTMENAPIELYQEFMQDISSEVDRESKIISDLLAIVKMDSTNEKLNLENVNMNESISATLHRLLPIAQKKKIDLILESNRAVTAEIDESKFSLAISNLVENAIKYNSEKGFVHVTLNADHRYMFIKVQDNGVGIPEDCINKIFERFYRVDKARSRETGGTGLGLSITQKIINLHHGEIKVYSKLGEGTTFSVRVPLTYSNGQEGIN